MTLSEWVRLRNYKGGRIRSILGREIPPWVCEAYSVVGIFLFGCACQQLTTDVAKYTVGRLRPHFFNSGNYDVKDEPRSGRPVTDKADTIIEKVE
ncbi:Putative phosphatidate phosphatase [Eumeta japonica]|uniref:Phosphatidate phosphatase n=1 Tax=Eumeta variegata TaxID=151549 RepID=A0A4C1UM30_EUMVA|nr:Putative phosphatidate phosphatase [Eumeta japonica]